MPRREGASGRSWRRWRDVSEGRPGGGVGRTEPAWQCPGEHRVAGDDDCSVVDGLRPVSATMGEREQHRRAGFHVEVPRRSSMGSSRHPYGSTSDRSTSHPQCTARPRLLISRRTSRRGSIAGSSRRASQPGRTSGSRSTRAGSSGNQVAAQPRSSSNIGMGPCPAAVNRYGNSRSWRLPRQISPRSSSRRIRSRRTDREMRPGIPVARALNPSEPTAPSWRRISRLHRSPRCSIALVNGQ